MSSWSALVWLYWLHGWYLFWLISTYVVSTSCMIFWILPLPRTISVYICIPVFSCKSNVIFLCVFSLSFMTGRLTSLEWDGFCLLARYFCRWTILSAGLWFNLSLYYMYLSTSHSAWHLTTEMHCWVTFIIVYCFSFFFLYRTHNYPSVLIHDSPIT